MVAPRPFCGGPTETSAAHAAYEQDMIRYGFTAVQTSLKHMQRFHAMGTLARTATKAFLQVVASVPPLRAAFLGG
jgi:hypothetical protein